MYFSQEKLQAMNLIKSEYDDLVQHPNGNMGITVGLIVVGISYYLGRKITDIEV